MPPAAKMQPKNIKDRYEIQGRIGQGGMGIVYKAFDTKVRRLVAVKTIKDMPSRIFLDLFRRECEILAAICHPNIIEIFDVGEFEDEGETKPYFVMPLLPGSTLEDLIRTTAQRLSVERVIEIACDSCRGLQAAHERGLVHRDLKPGNIFVMQDDSVKIIDFGVAHMADTGLTMSIQGGTLQYMSPEQVQMQSTAPSSDIFSLGVVCYYTLTGRRPFEGATVEELRHAILTSIPPPVSDLNPSVSQPVSRVIHKALAKQPWHRFGSAREFAETLRKAFRNEPIEIFDSARIAPRLQRATAALQGGNLQFAGEILADLEAEGQFDSGMPRLRRQIEEAQRLKNIQYLLESARTRVEQEEYLLALQKLDEVLQLEPGNAAALALKGEIDQRRGGHKVEEWLRLVRQHLDNRAFGHARSAIQNVFQLKPNDSRALQLLSEVGRQEQEFLNLRQQKRQLYDAALAAWKNGEVSTALTTLERLIELDRRVPDTSSEPGATYQNVFNQVRSESGTIHDAYQRAQKHLADRKFSLAREVCDEFLQKYSNHALFQALKLDIDERQQQDVSARIAQIERQVEAEPDLGRQENILKEAVQAFPNEAHFQQLLRRVNEKKSLVNSIVAKARRYEESNRFAEALSQWQTLRTVHSTYPGLEFDLERVARHRVQQVKVEARLRAIEHIRFQIEANEYGRGLNLVQAALIEFPADRELIELQTLAQKGADRAAESSRLLARGRELLAQGSVEEAFQTLRLALSFDEQSHVARDVLLAALLKQARAVMNEDRRSAGKLIEEALQIDPGNTLAKGLQSVVFDLNREEQVATRLEIISKSALTAEQLEAKGDLQGALKQVKHGLSYVGSDGQSTAYESRLRGTHQRLENRHQAILADFQRQVKHMIEGGDFRNARKELTYGLAIYTGEPGLQELVKLLLQRVERRRNKLLVTVGVLLAGIVLITGVYLRTGAGSVTGGAPATASAAPKAREAEGQLVAIAPPVPPLVEKWRQIQPSAAPHARVSKFTIALQTQPSGAHVEIDPNTAEVQSCTSPCSIQFTPGRHEVSASLDGYRRSLKIVTLPGQDALEIALHKQLGTVIVNSVSPGASLELDGSRLTEKTPATLMLPPGTYKLRILTSGSPDVQVFEVKDDKTVTLGEK